jgi:hypothetical protein
MQVQQPAAVAGPADACTHVRRVLRALLGQHWAARPPRRLAIPHDGARPADATPTAGSGRVVFRRLWVLSLLALLVQKYKY